MEKKGNGRAHKRARHLLLCMVMLMLMFLVSGCSIKSEDITLSNISIDGLQVTATVNISNIDRDNFLKSESNTLRSIEIYYAFTPDKVTALEADTVYVAINPVSIIIADFNLSENKYDGVYSYNVPEEDVTAFKNDDTATSYSKELTFSLPEEAREKGVDFLVVLKGFDYDTGSNGGASGWASSSIFGNISVKFDSAGGSAVPVQIIEKGAKATKPADPTRSGYTFEGWYNGDTAFDFNTAVNENITLTAHWKEDEKPTPTPVDSKHKVSGSYYVVTSAGTVSLVKAKSKNTFTLPATVKINGKKFKVTGIRKSAFKGKKVRNLVVKTKKLTKKSVKGSLKGSKVNTVKVKVGKKKENKAYLKKYKKIFTKKNAGRKVKVKI